MTVPALACAPITLGRQADIGAPVTLTADRLERHVFVSGATGTGKTAFLLALAVQMLDRGRGVLFCTTKHDPALPRALAWAAARRDRLSQFWLFDAMQAAHLYNPTATDNPLLLVRQILALLPPVPPGSEAAYHQDVVRQFLLAAVRAMMATGREPVLDDVLQLAMHPDLALPILRQTLQAVGALELMTELDSFFDRFRIGTQWRLDLAQSALAGLTAALEALRVGRMERLFRRPSSDLSLLRAIRRAAIIYMGLPRAQDKESGRFGQLFLADLDAEIQEIQATEGRLAHAPFTIILDEFASYAIHEFAAVFEQARSAGIAVIVSVQTPSALADAQRGLSEEFRDACVGNCGTILSFRLGPGRGAQYLSDYVGKADRWFVQESQTEGRSRTWHALDLGTWFGLTARSDQRSRFTGVRQQKDQVLEARELTQTLTRVGEAYLLSPPGPLRLWTEWADAEAAPADWAYREALARWEPAPPRALDLGRRVRLTLLARAEQAVA
ncbi:MAG: type IV secretory system conjugative DNA transfer family protein, partial [Candidatus Rokuibacteriota bacterium]